MKLALSFKICIELSSVFYDLLLHLHCLQSLMHHMHESTLASCVAFSRVFNQLYYINVYRIWSQQISRHDQIATRYLYVYIRQSNSILGIVLYQLPIYLVVNKSANFHYSTVLQTVKYDKLYEQTEAPKQCC